MKRTTLSGEEAAALVSRGLGAMIGRLALFGLVLIGCSGASSKAGDSGVSTSTAGDLSTWINIGMLVVAAIAAYTARESSKAAKKSAELAGAWDKQIAARKRADAAERILVGTLAVLDVMEKSITEVPTGTTTIEYWKKHEEVVAEFQTCRALSIVHARGCEALLAQIHATRRMMTEGQTGYANAMAEFAARHAKGQAKIHELNDIMKSTLAKSNSTALPPLIAAYRKEVTGVLGSVATLGAPEVLEASLYTAVVHEDGSIYLRSHRIGSSPVRDKETVFAPPGTGYPQLTEHA